MASPSSDNHFQSRRLAALMLWFVLVGVAVVPVAAASANVLP